ncbi:MAG TPA: hypothetical protein VE569_13675, partial [Acidimicrobiia bacterium]|nr:hypothetical protein [Acidimicrobiia bacterium]
KYVGVSTASDAACFVLVLDAPLRVRRRRRVLAIDAAASPKHAHVLLMATTKSGWRKRNLPSTE